MPENAQTQLHNCTHLKVLITSKVMLKILQARLQQYVNRELPDVQERQRTRDQIANIPQLVCNSYLEKRLSYRTSLLSERDV